MRQLMGARCQPFHIMAWHIGMRVLCLTQTVDTVNPTTKTWQLPIPIDNAPLHYTFTAEGLQIVHDAPQSPTQQYAPINSALSCWHSHKPLSASSTTFRTHTLCVIHIKAANPCAVTSCCKRILSHPCPTTPCHNAILLQAVLAAGGPGGWPGVASASTAS
jgi:hypothetical protein